MSFDLRLEGLRALVTGGTKGVGAAVVQAEPELFDAPAGDDVFDAPVFDAPALARAVLDTLADAAGSRARGERARDHRHGAG